MDEIAPVLILCPESNRNQPFRRCGFVLDARHSTEYAYRAGRDRAIGEMTRAEAEASDEEVTRVSTRPQYLGMRQDLIVQLHPRHSNTIPTKSISTNTCSNLALSGFGQLDGLLDSSTQI